MTDLTSLAAGGALAYDYQIEGWYGFLNGGDYTAEQTAKLAAALLYAQETTMDNLLPDGCYWLPEVGQVIGPVGTELSVLDDLLREAAKQVTERLADIEHDTLGA